MRARSGATLASAHSCAPLRYLFTLVLILATVVEIVARDWKTWLGAKIVSDHLRGPDATDMH